MYWGLRTKSWTKQIGVRFVLRQRPVILSMDEKKRSRTGWMRLRFRLVNTLVRGKMGEETPVLLAS
jgi:hypothetical protein